MSFTGFMNMPMTISTAGAVDKFGKHTFGTATSVNGRFRQTNRTIATRQNENEPIDGVVILGPSVVVVDGDKITFDSVEYRVMQILHSVDGKGNAHHKELMVQRWAL